MLRQIRLVFAFAALAIATGITPGMMAAQGPPQEAQAGGPGQPRAATGAATGADDVAVNNVYIVQMSDEPVLAYRGGLAGRNATRPTSRRQKIDPDDANVAGYASYLDARHDQVLARAGGRKVYGYRYSFNGFAARLTESEAEVLKSTPGVVRVIKDELRTVNTSSTPAFLGLDQPGGLWDRLAGPEHAGEDIIIGIIDSGVWPESLSFSDRENRRGIPSATGRVVYDRMWRWRNRCQSGEQFTTNTCNNKLIGAQRFNAAWSDGELTGDEVIARDRPWEFTSPRDYNGHGTHTASTAGGNHGVPTTGAATVFGPISGMAPRARIAAYKALWSTAGCGDGKRLHVRSRGRHRQGGRGRRRRHQLFDLRHDVQLRRSRGARVFQCCRVGRVRVGLGRQQRSERRDGGASEPVDHDGGRGHAQS